MSRESGQATVELVALVPLLVVCALGVWQLAVAGHAVWAADAAARAAARASAVHGDAGVTRRAALRVLPASLRRRARVSERDGAVEVVVAIPSVVGDGSVTRWTTTARFARQR